MAAQCEHAAFMRLDMQNLQRTVGRLGEQIEQTVRCNTFVGWWRNH